MSSSSSVYLVDLETLPEWGVLKEKILAKITLSRDAPCRSSFEKQTQTQQLLDLEHAVLGASSLRSLSEHLGGALSVVKDLVFLRESRYACDQLIDKVGEILHYALFPHLIYITEVHY